MATKAQLQEELKSTKKDLAEATESNGRLQREVSELQSANGDMSETLRDRRESSAREDEKIRLLQSRLDGSLDARTAEFFKGMILDIVERMKYEP